LERPQTGEKLEKGYQFEKGALGRQDEPYPGKKAEVEDAVAARTVRRKRREKDLFKEVCFEKGEKN